jgi:shikimate kinase
MNGADAVPSEGENVDGSPGQAPNASSKPELLFLIGYRGSGKTTVAALVADLLGWRWVDADTVLESHGRTIAQIFAEEGEAGFRRRESVVLEEFCRRREYVIATGGGVVLNEANRTRLRQSGCVVWLTAAAEVLAQRLEGDRTSAARRPVLTVGGRSEIEELIRVREPLYRACADLAMDTTGRSPAEVAEEIIARLAL